METVKMGICFFDEDDNIVSSRMIGTNWEVNVENDLDRQFGVDVYNEISFILKENLEIQLTQSVIKEMLLEIKDKE
jgi:hypothetical protein